MMKFHASTGHWTLFIDDYTVSGLADHVHITEHHICSYGSTEIYTCRCQYRKVLTNAYQSGHIYTTCVATEMSGILNFTENLDQITTLCQTICGD